MTDSVFATVRTFANRVRPRTPQRATPKKVLPAAAPRGDSDLDSDRSESASPPPVTPKKGIRARKPATPTLKPVGRKPPSPQSATAKAGRKSGAKRATAPTKPSGPPPVAAQRKATPRSRIRRPPPVATAATETESDASSKRVPTAAGESSVSAASSTSSSSKKYIPSLPKVIPPILQPLTEPESVAETSRNETWLHDSALTFNAPTMPTKPAAIRSRRRPDTRTRVPILVPCPPSSNGGSTAPMPVDVVAEMNQTLSIPKMDASPRKKIQSKSIDARKTHRAKSSKNNLLFTAPQMANKRKRIFSRPQIAAEEEEEIAVTPDSDATKAEKPNVIRGTPPEMHPAPPPSATRLRPTDVFDEFDSSDDRKSTPPSASGRSPSPPSVGLALEPNRRTSKRRIAKSLVPLDTSAKRTSAREHERSSSSALSQPQSPISAAAATFRDSASQPGLATNGIADAGSSTESEQETAKQRKQRIARSASRRKERRKAKRRLRSNKQIREKLETLRINSSSSGSASESEGNSNARSTGPRIVPETYESISKTPKRFRRAKVVDLAKLSVSKTRIGEEDDDIESGSDELESVLYSPALPKCIAPPIISSPPHDAEAASVSSEQPNIPKEAADAVTDSEDEIECTPSLSSKRKKSVARKPKHKRKRFIEPPPHQKGVVEELPSPASSATTPDLLWNPRSAVRKLSERLKEDSADPKTVASGVSQLKAALFEIDAECGINSVVTDPVEKIPPRVRKRKRVASSHRLQPAPTDEVEDPISDDAEEPLKAKGEAHRRQQLQEEVNRDLREYTLEPEPLSEALPVPPERKASLPVSAAAANSSPQPIRGATTKPRPSSLGLLPAPVLSPSAAAAIAQLSASVTTRISIEATFPQSQPATASAEQVRPKSSSLSLLPSPKSAEVLKPKRR